MPKYLRLLRKASLIFVLGCKLSSFIKSNNKLFNSHSFEIQCAVILKKDMKFDEVQASIVNDILLGIAYKL